jgi:hypothetical protein
MVCAGLSLFFDAGQEFCLWVTKLTLLKAISAVQWQNAEIYRQNKLKMPHAPTRACHETANPTAA